MAFSGTSYFNNAIVGIPQVGADVDIFENSTTPTFAVGTRFTRSDGNEYVYAHFGAAAGTLSQAGFIVSTDISESGTSQALARILASGSVTAISGETITPGTKGSHYVELIGGGVEADEYAGGYFQITGGGSSDLAGGRYTYRIRGNTASSAKTTGAKLTYYLELYEPIQQTLAGAQDSGMRILGSRYANLESAVARTDMFVAGVTTASHMATDTFGWVQTRGLAGVRTDASNCGLGSAVAISENVPGCANGFADLKTATGTHFQEQQIIGYCIDSCIAATATQLMAVVINI